MATRVKLFSYLIDDVVGEISAWSLIKQHNHAERMPNAQGSAQPDGFGSSRFLLILNVFFFVSRSK